MNKMIIESDDVSVLFKAAALLKNLNLIIAFEIDQEPEQDSDNQNGSVAPFCKDESLDKMWQDGLTLEERKKEMAKYIDSLDWSRKDTKK